ncbi:hypothetical protein ABZX72_29345 [Streptomyces cyaneofuscatus]|uniref:hypothetical protein n=1 Tax=Streptomyces cyaneofuscatus TaxID=66883 RepID=UPI0033B89648
MSAHLTQHRIAAALAAAIQPEGERPWTLLLTKPPRTHVDVRSVIYRAEHPEDVYFLPETDEPTRQAEASRARIVQDLARRDGYLAALSAAEHILSRTPVLPVRVDVSLAEWDNGPHITLTFHQDPAAVRRFAAHVGTEVTERPHSEKSVRTETFGATESGISFEAYTLTDAPAVTE